MAFWSRGTKNDRLKGTDGVQLIYPVTQTQKYNEVQRSDKSGKLEGCWDSNSEFSKLCTGTGGMDAYYVLSGRGI